jgi:hypothetical protein
LTLSTSTLIPSCKILWELKNFLPANCLALYGLARSKVKRVWASKNISGSVAAVV